MSGTNRNFRAAEDILATFTVRIHVQASRFQLVRHTPLCQAQQTVTPPAEQMT